MARKLINDLLQELVEEETKTVTWPRIYRNTDTNRVYKPHHDREANFVFTDTPRFFLLRGGEGSGKTVAGVIKDLERLRRGMNGIAVSPNLPHFKRSLWPEMRRWIPWDMVHETQRYMRNPSWKPHTSFTLVFYNEVGGLSELILGGIDNPLHFEGPNVSFAHIDEGRGIESDEALKVLAGRVRIPGPNGEPPQLYITTTPRKHWLFEYWGPIKEEDPYLEFKKQAEDLVLFTEDNVTMGNLDEDFVNARGSALTEAQKRVRLEGGWEDEDDPLHFLESISMWDALREDLPAVRKKRDNNKDWSDVLAIGVDAATSRDHFSIVAVSRHPRNREHVAVRSVRVWEPPKGGKIDFEGTEDARGPENYIRWLCKNFHVAVMVYDAYQLHQMAQRLARDGVVWTREFSQHAARLKADQGLYDLILAGKIAHSGDPKLRAHLQNADVKMDDELRKRRLVKRLDSLKIDAAVSLSMAAFEIIRLNI